MFFFFLPCLCPNLLGIIFLCKLSTYAVLHFQWHLWTSGGGGVILLPPKSVILTEDQFHPSPLVEACCLFQFPNETEIDIWLFIWSLSAETCLFAFANRINIFKAALWLKCYYDESCNKISTCWGWSSVISSLAEQPAWMNLNFCL